MRKFISSTIRALADFIEFDDALELGIKNGALNDLTKREMARAQSEQLLDRYARLWSINGERPEAARDEMRLARAEVKARRLDRKRIAKARELERREARELKELGIVA